MAFFAEKNERLETMEDGQEGVEFDQRALDRYDRLLEDDKLTFKNGESAEDSEINTEDERLNDRDLIDKYDKILEDSEREENSDAVGNSVDMKEQYYDDNGKLYRSGNELIPNSEYEINGYRYKTNENGSIISAEGILHMKDREGRLQIRDSIADIGKGDEIGRAHV